MVLHLSGHRDEELLVIKTRELTLAIKGKPVHPTVDRLNLHQTDAGEWVKAELEIFSNNGDFEAFVFDPFAPGNKSVYTGEKVFPCFYENQTYQLVIEDKTGGKLEFFHENKHLRQAVGYIGNSKVMIGNLNFRNDIGYSQFTILGENGPILTVKLEVFPAKIEYRNDYYKLLTEVNAELYNLAFDFMRRTYFSATLIPSTKPSPTEFFSIIQYCFEKLYQALERIERNPHHMVSTTERLNIPDKVRRTNGRTLKWLTKNQYMLEKSNRGITVNKQKYLPPKILESRKTVNFDTFENRFVKWVIKTIENRLQEFQRTYQKAFEDKGYDEMLRRKIASMRDRLARFGRYSFLSDVGEIHNLANLSLVLQMAPGYREVYKYYLMLIKGLSLQSDVFNISVKNLALLYEYWCFLKMNAILRNKYRLEKHDLIKVNNKGLTVQLDKTKRANIRYTDPRNGDKIVLSYNNLLNIDMPTTKQQPDNMLTLKKENSDTRYQYVFDAKYRLNPAVPGSSYCDKYGKPGPEEDDINTMHRYRDAIMYYYGEQFSKTVFGAYILFPFRDGKVYAGLNDGQPHQFYSSIEQVNIGGLPFLPGEISLVEKFLDELIVDSSEAAFERAVGQSGADEYYQKKYQRRTVLVGSLKTKQQLQANLDHNFYHIPYERVKKTCFNIEYVALYQLERLFPGQGGIRYYGQVADMEVVKRSEIKEIPGDNGRLYVRFKIKEWQELAEPIRPAGYGVRSHIYTTLPLLKLAAELPELSIRSEEEFRLYNELKRLGRAIKIRPNKKDLDDECHVKAIEFNNLLLEVKEGQLVITDGEERETISLAMLKSRPRSVVKKILR